MARLFVLILLGPFWVHFLLAGGVIAFGLYQHDLDSKAYAEKQRLAQSAPPEVVSITDFKSDAHPSLPVELNLRAQIAIEHSIQLVETKNGKSVRERAMYILLAPDAAEDAKVAYGAVVLYPSEVALFVDWAEQRVAADGASGAFGPILTLDGLRGDPFEKSHILDALKNRGFTAGEGFTYIEPFLTGREAGLAIRKRDEPLKLAYFYYAAAVFALMGVMKLGLRFRGAGTVLGAVPPKMPATKPNVASASAPLASPSVGGGAAVHANNANDFIGALTRRAEAAAQPSPKMPPATVSGRSIGERMGGGFGRTMRKVAALGVAVVMYLLFMSYSDTMGVPSMVSLVGGKGQPAGVPVAVAVATEAVATALDTTGSIAASPVTVADKPDVSPAAAGVQTGGVTAFDQAFDRAAVLAKATLWATGVSAKAAVQLGVWRAALPLWLVASVLAGLILVPAVFMLRRFGAGTARKSEMDPYERLLQRRMAEKARAEKAMIGGLGMQRA